MESNQFMCIDSIVLSDASMQQNKYSGEWMEYNSIQYNAQDRNILVRDKSTDGNFAEDALNWLEYMSGIENASETTYESNSSENSHSHSPSPSWDSSSQHSSGLYSDNEEDEMDQSGLCTRDQYEFDTLQLELLALQARRQFLQYNQEHQNSSPSLQHFQNLAHQERQRLVHAQAKHAYLTNMLLDQQMHNTMMKTLVIQSPINIYQKSLISPLESYIHLPYDGQERRQKLMQMRDEKCFTAYNYVMQSLQHVNACSDYSQFESFEKFGILYTFGSCVSRVENCRLETAVDMLVQHYSSKNHFSHKYLGPTHRTVDEIVRKDMLHGQFLDRVPYPKQSPDDPGFIVMESKTAMFHYIMPNGDVVLVADYIDQDDRTSYSSKANRQRYRRDLTKCMVFTKYYDANGNEGIYYRNMAFIRHHYPIGDPPPNCIKESFVSKTRSWMSNLVLCLKNHNVHNLETQSKDMD